jgi:signal transduction histidine kinase
MSTKVLSFDKTHLMPGIGLPDHDRAGHSVHFYSDDSFLIEGLSGFIGAALTGEDAAVVIATKAHREALAQRLEGLGIVNAKAQGRYVELDAAETLATFMLEGYPDAACFEASMGAVLAHARRAIRGDNPRIAAFGEMVALLWAQGKCEAAVRLERLWNDLAAKHSFSLRCAYPMTAFSGEDHGQLFLRICAEHSDVIPADGYTAIDNREERLRSIARLQQKEQAHDALKKAKVALEEEIAERRQVEAKLRASERSLRELSGLLLRMQDEERRHLGRELHDSVGQYLAALKMGIDLLKAGVTEESQVQQAEDLVQLAERAITEVRTISYLLYPPMLEEMGLKTAMPWYLDGFAKRSGIRTTLESPHTLGRLSRDVELAIFRILQESLTNVHRHSGSETAHVRVFIKDGAVNIEVKDTGKGIPPAILESAGAAAGSSGVGLRGMAERTRQFGGELKLLSTSEGTTVRATIPCEPPKAEERAADVAVGAA